MSVQEAYDLTALGGKVRPYFRDRDGRPSPGVVITEVLCWWCRERHHPDEVEKCMALPRKPAAVNGSASSTSKSLGAGLLSPFSELWGFLTTTQYEDGTKRQTGKLSVSCESGMLGLLLTDPETGQYAFLNGHSLDDLLLEAETRMGDGSLSWRPSRWQGKGRGK
jgi:hypothetical protein